MNRKTNFLLYLIGNFIYGIAQWVLQIGILKVLGEYQTGLYSISNAILAPLILLFSFGLNTLYVTNKKFSFQKYLNNRILHSIIMFLVYVCIIVISGYQQDAFGLLLFIGTFRLFEMIFEIIFAVHIEEKEQYKIGIIKINSAIIIILSYVIGISYLKNSTLAFFIINIGFIIYLLFYINKLNLKVRLNFSNQLVWEGLLISSALLISSLNTNITKYYLEIFGNTEMVGIFTSLIIIYSAGKIFITSFYSFLLPYIVDNIEDKKFLKRSFNLINIVFLIFSIFICYIAEYFKFIWVPLLFTRNFLKYDLEITIVIISSFLLFHSILMDLYLHAFKHYRFNLIIQIIVIISVIISLLCFSHLNMLLNATISFFTFAFVVFIQKLFYSYILIKGESK
ncbi:hypothetical protein [Macrococcus brunensis]|uniref:hypothetical protein n=1 Tax=Macrococcus brunensis TaxID=198483 RepID=UPI001EF15790|nr:hypothetical protein [Macrococcus brunensis]ULG72696.1 hypothetical protein MGG12_04035 [Macrococcus brunensis]